jgi:hypothetical protein
MKSLIVFMCLFLCSCDGQFWLTPVGHRAFYKSKDKQLSCYKDNCCWPYKEKVMVCAYETGLDGVAVYLRFVPDK